MTVFITGDRKVSEVYPGMVAIEMLRARNEGHAIMTGDNSGVEEIVRLIGEQAGVNIGVVTTPDAPDRRQAYDARHLALATQHIHVVAIHVDPHSSSLVASLFDMVPDDAMTLRTPVDLL